MTLDEAIKHCEEVAEENEKFCFKKGGKGGYFNEDTDWNNIKCAKEHRQLAEWLTELKAHREIHDVLLQLLVDLDLNICCDDLMYNEEEERICKEDCNFKAKGCWVRWAKMKAREKGKVIDVIKDIPTLGQRTGRWIPVNERLPEEEGEYLISVEYKPEANYENIYTERGGWIGGQWNISGFEHCGKVEDIIAWMPLPAPFKPQESEDKK